MSDPRKEEIPEVKSDQYYVKGLGVYTKEELTIAAKEGMIKPSTDIYVGVISAWRKGSDILSECLTPNIIIILKIVGVFNLVLGILASIGMFTATETNTLTLGLGIGFFIEGVVVCVLFYSIAFIAENLNEIRKNTSPLHPKNRKR